MRHPPQILTAISSRGSRASLRISVPKNAKAHGQRRVREMAGALWNCRPHRFFVDAAILEFAVKVL